MGSTYSKRQKTKGSVHDIEIERMRQVEWPQVASHGHFSRAHGSADAIRHQAGQATLTANTSRYPLHEVNHESDG